MSPSQRASVARTGPATQKLRPGHGPVYVTDLQVVVASVQGRTALLQVTGPGEAFRIVKGEPGTSVRLTRHTLTVVEVTGARPADHVTVTVRPG
ncbi:hypothetical protein [Actinomadura sp. HBU206391]|uniref:hypothetical protein n=1 Tax=Actinomadura sp. HBU206391 TaxID=2731692 RepID=UPI00164F5302|nr:hypothetical protein [Actinomadura sp. HBU206391]MBC6459372.1 hypothetical protein [Actinomadura sp. HBU206391]